MPKKIYITYKSNWIISYFGFDYTSRYISLDVLSTYDNINLIDCSFCNLSSLPELPNSLQELNCYHNELTVLPQLPNGLQKINCGYNKLTVLPQLPNSLQYLWCSYNKLSILPELPNSLKEFYCYNNRYKIYHDNFGKKHGIIKIHPPLPNSKGIFRLCVYCETIQIMKYNYFTKIFYM